VRAFPNSSNACTVTRALGRYDSGCSRSLIAFRYPLSPALCTLAEHASEPAHPVAGYVDLTSSEGPGGPSERHSERATLDLNPGLPGRLRPEVDGLHARVCPRSRGHAFHLAGACAETPNGRCCRAVIIFRRSASSRRQRPRSRGATGGRTTTDRQHAHNHCERVDRHGLRVSAWFTSASRGRSYSIAVRACGCSGPNSGVGPPCLLPAPRAVTSVTDNILCPRMTCGASSPYSRRSLVAALCRS